MRPDLASYEIGERWFVTNDDPGRELPPADRLALVKHDHLRMSPQLEETFRCTGGADQARAAEKRTAADA